MSDNLQSVSKKEPNEIAATLVQGCSHCGGTGSQESLLVADSSLTITTKMTALDIKASAIDSKTNAVDSKASAIDSTANAPDSKASLIDSTASAANSQASAVDSQTNVLTTAEAHAGEGLSKWEQDTFRDILNNANNTLRFQVQLAVPLLAGCVTALNIIPPQAHEELLNLLDRWVFIPVLCSMGVAYFGLEMHWTVQKGKILGNVEGLTKLVRRKYDMVHLAIILQAAGLILLMIFVLLEFK